MPNDLNIDFGTGDASNAPLPASSIGSNNDQTDVTNLDGSVDIEDLGSQSKNPSTNAATAQDTAPVTNDESNEPFDLAEGNVVEFDGAEYTVNKDGALVGANGVVFKTKAETEQLIKDSNVINPTDLNIDNVRKTIGIDIVDDAGKPVTFDNTTEGISSYVNNVIALKADAIKNETINELYSEYPVVKDFINHIIATGDAKSFGVIPDRSSITIAHDDVAQQEAIIRDSFKEFSKGDPEGYIKYLKDSGALYDEANKELAALQRVDGDRRTQTEAKAQAAQAQAVAAEKAYWDDIKATIDSKEIAGYQIPETIIVNKGGKQIAATPNDFFNYLYKADKDGYSQYAKDEQSVSDEQKRGDEVLRAYLRFTGGSYKDLVNMAINKQEVRRLRIDSSNNNKRTIKVIKPNSGKADVLLS